MSTRPAPTPTRIAFYPAFASQVDLNEQYYRSGWYLRPIEPRLVTFPVYPELSRPPTVPPSHFDPDITATITASAGPVSAFTPPAADAVDDTLRAADMVLLWSRDRLGELRSRLDRLGVAPPIWRVDPDEEQHEGPFYLRASAEDPRIRPPLLAAARAHLDRLLDHVAARKVYVLCSGPSVGTLQGHDFSDGSVIICNSLVKNDQLLPALRPRLVVATDPIFHAGVSSYAASFRRRLRFVMEEYGAWFATVFRDYPVFSAWANDAEAERIAAVPIDRTTQSPILDLRADDHVMATSNVLTLLMLPIAATVAEEMVLAGCDGRPLTEDEYYWQHDPNSQFVDELASIRYVHPAFFNVDFQDYYLQHCATLADMIDAIEAAGTTVSSLTPSHIPALKERQVEPTASLP